MHNLEEEKLETDPCLIYSLSIYSNSAGVRGSPSHLCHVGNGWEDVGAHNVVENHSVLDQLLLWKYFQTVVISALVTTLARKQGKKNQLFMKFLPTPLQGNGNSSHFRRNTLFQMTPNILLSSTQEF